LKRGALALPEDGQHPPDCALANRRAWTAQARSGFHQKDTMNPIKLIGILLIAAGALGLAYGGFSYPKETTALKLGTLELKVQETKTVSVPLILSGAAMVLGVFLLVFNRK